MQFKYQSKLLWEDECEGNNCNSMSCNYFSVVDEDDQIVMKFQVIV